MIHCPTSRKRLAGLLRADLPKTGQERTDPAEQLQSLHVLRSDLLRLLLGHAGHDTGVAAIAQAYLPPHACRQSP